MNFITGSYCGDAANAALVLVRSRRIRDNLPIVMAGVCEYLEGDVEKPVKVQTINFGDSLLEWFDKRGLSFCAKGTASKCIRAMGRAFVKWYSTYSRNELDIFTCEKASWSVFLSVGEECFYAWNGDAEIHLLNLCFNQLSSRKLTWYTDEMRIEFAKVESGVGILLGTKSFCEYLPEQRLKECLAVKSMEHGEQIEKHLKEAVCGVTDRGAKCPVAVLLITRE